MLTHKVDVRVVNRGLLQADVEDDEDGMCQIAGKTNVGKRDPETQGQEALDKTWVAQNTEENVAPIHLCLRYLSF